MQKRAFTLIELLIVVAIIAILAAIAVPNFLEAQTRAKVSRVKADHRTMDTALTAYAVDFNGYPACHRFGVVLNPFPDPDDTGGVASPAGHVLERITTPVAYLTQVAFRDPFKLSVRLAASTARGQAFEDGTPVSEATDLVARLNTYIYQAVNDTTRVQTTDDSFSDAWNGKGSMFFLHSAGPDSKYSNLGGVLANEYDDDDTILLIYDPTNGTVSFGCIFRANGSPGGSSTYAGGSGLWQAIQAGN